MFRLIDAEKTNYSITRMITLLGVSRSGYYKWLATQIAGPTPVAVRRAGLDAKVAEFYAASDDVYGSPRIVPESKMKEYKRPRKTIERIPEGSDGHEKDWIRAYALTPSALHTSCRKAGRSPCCLSHSRNWRITARCR